MKTVLVGVTGCIAAYKACELVRALQKADASLNVKVVMTEHAAQFVGPTTFRALTGNEVALDLFDEAGAPVHHVSLAKEADVFVIAPATANVISKIARGQADDLLTTTVLATSAPVVVAPAMNTGMWDNPVTRENVALLSARGMRIVSPQEGWLACGDEGAGRLADLPDIVAATLGALDASRSMEGKRVLITAGPTHEPLDPVRYIGNRSSGRMGYALAAEALSRAAQVTLVTGPVELAAPSTAQVVRCTTAREMLSACRAPFADADIAIFVAAVADWRPKAQATGKIKRDGGDLDLTLVPNPDIAATLCAEKGDTYAAVFAAETGDPIEAARAKLSRKNADLCIANNVAEPSVGMGARDNHVWLVDAAGVCEVARADKRTIAKAILDRITSACG